MVAIAQPRAAPGRAFFEANPVGVLPADVTPRTAHTTAAHAATEAAAVAARHAAATGATIAAAAAVAAAVAAAAIAAEAAAPDAAGGAGVTVASGRLTSDAAGDAGIGPTRRGGGRWHAGIAGPSTRGITRRETAGQSGAAAVGLGCRARGTGSRRGHRTTR